MQPKIQLQILLFFASFFLLQPKAVSSTEDSATILFNSAIKLSFSKPDQALIKLQKSLKVLSRQNHKNEDLRYKIMYEMGIAYYYVGLYEQALPYFLDCKKIAISKNDSKEIAVQNNSLGIIYKNLKNYNKALVYYKEAFEYHNKVGNLNGMSTTYNNIGALYEETGKYKEALENYKLSLQLEIGIKDYEDIGTSYYNLAEVYSKIKDDEKAEYYFKQALKLAQDSLYSNLEKEVNFQMAHFYKQKNDFQEAIKYYDRFNLLRDSIDKIEFNKQIAEYEAIYNKEKQEAEISLLNKDKFIQNIELNRVRSINNLFILLTSFFVIFIILIAIMLKNKMRNAKILKEKTQQLEQSNDQLIAQKEKIEIQNKKLDELNASKDKLFSIIGHDLKNYFNLLIGYSNLIIKSPNFPDQEQREKYSVAIFKAAKSGYTLLENLLQWARSQTGKINFEPQVHDLYEIITSNIYHINPIAKNKEITVHNHIEPFTYCFFDFEMISTVVRNLLNNAIKFTPNMGNIWIRNEYCIENDIKYVLISIKDSGVGISDEDLSRLFRLDQTFSKAGTNDEAGSGLGLMLCKEFVGRNGGKIWVESEIQKGSDFKFTLPAEMDKKIIDDILNMK